MNSQQIKIFLCLSACRNFSLAAEQLYLSQSVVSYHVRMLEKEVGFTLFDRNTHGVQLTEAGAAFHKSMRSIARQYRDALNKAQKIATQDRGKLCVCFGPPTSPTMIGQIMDRVCMILPPDEIELSRQNYEDVLQSVLSDAADILFTYPPFFRKNLGLRRADFCETYLSCMMRSGHPLAERKELVFDDLKGQTLILVDSENARIEHKDIYRKIQQAGENAPKLESAPKSFEQAQGFAITGRGIMLVRTMDREYHANIDGLVSVPLSDARVMPLIAVWREDNVSESVKKLIKGISKKKGKDI